MNIMEQVSDLARQAVEKEKVRNDWHGKRDDGTRKRNMDICKSICDQILPRVGTTENRTEIAQIYITLCDLAGIFEKIGDFDKDEVFLDGLFKKRLLARLKSDFQDIKIEE
jgi:hypothetical protein